MKVLITCLLLLTCLLLVGLVEADLNQPLVPAIFLLLVLELVLLALEHRRYP